MAESKIIGSCLTCKHLRLTKSKETGTTMPDGTCDAYPEGIPVEIQFGSIVHDKPFKNDNGIQYERKEIKGNPPAIRV